jgi:hypothetical protein
MLRGRCEHGFLRSLRQCFVCTQLRACLREAQRAARPTEPKPPRKTTGTRRRFQRFGEGVQVDPFVYHALSRGGSRG